LLPEYGADATSRIDETTTKKDKEKEKEMRERLQSHLHQVLFIFGYWLS
jgi:hypothetical protein